MITLPLLITIIYTILFLQITHRQPKIHKHFSFFLIIFASGILLHGISSGNHEITNYLHHKFCIQDNSSICQIINYNDDNFSHTIFYLSSFLMTVSLLFFEKAQPQTKKLPNLQIYLILFNGLLIGLGLFANLAFEKLGIDLYAFGLLSIISATLLWQNRHNLRHFPITLYCAFGYSLGTASTIIYKLFIA